MAASLANAGPSIRSSSTLSGIPTRSDALGNRTSLNSRSTVFLGSGFRKRDLFYYGFIRRAELFHHVVQCSAKCKSLSRIRRLLLQNFYFAWIKGLVFDVDFDGTLD